MFESLRWSYQVGLCPHLVRGSQDPACQVILPQNRIAYHTKCGKQLTLMALFFLESWRSVVSTKKYPIPGRRAPTSCSTKKETNQCQVIGIRFLKIYAALWAKRLANLASEEEIISPCQKGFMPSEKLASLPFCCIIWWRMPGGTTNYCIPSGSILKMPLDQSLIPCYGSLWDN